MANQQRKLLVCVVDDDEAVRAATTSLLRSAGYSTSSFCSAEDFLKSASRRSWACVVADIQMPGMSGIELAHLLRQKPPFTPVILMTARTEREVLSGGASPEAVCLLRKPFSANQLLGCVEIACGRP